MSVKYKDSNGNIEDIAGGLTADMAQDMIDTAVSHTGWHNATLNTSYLQPSGSLVAWYTMTADTDVRINFTYTAKVV